MNAENTEIPKVSVLIVTYNHEKYIAQAIESALTQETNFCFEIVIGDDCSTDGTQNIIRHYSDRHPDIIVPLLRNKNLGPREMPGKVNFVETLRSCKGEYVALLEGDDFWISSLKLQKQYDALESNAKYVGCVHNGVIIDEHGNTSRKLFSDGFHKEHFTVYDLLKGNPFLTNTVMYKRNIIFSLPAWYYNCPVGDYPIHVHAALQGDIKYVDEVMSAYRVHSGGVWQGMTNLLAIYKSLQVALIIRNSLPKRVYKNIMSGYVARLYIKYASHAYNKGLYNHVARNALRCLSLSHRNPKYYIPSILLLGRVLLRYGYRLISNVPRKSKLRVVR